MKKIIAVLFLLLMALFLYKVFVLMIFPTIIFTLKVFFGMLLIAGFIWLIKRK